MIAECATHIVLHVLPKQEDNEITPKVSSETGQGFDLNAEPDSGEIDAASKGNDRIEHLESLISEGEIVEKGQAMDDDPFELAPIIEAVMKERKGKK